MKIPLLVTAFGFVFSSLYAEVLETIPVIEQGNRKLVNAKIMKVKPDGLQILHDAGMETVPWMFLPAELAAKYRTDETMLKASAAATAEAGQKQRDAVAARDVWIQNEAARIANLNGLPAKQLFNALRARDWCLAHPEGGVLSTVDGDISISKEKRDRDLQAAESLINYRPEKPQPQMAQQSPAMPAPVARPGGSAAAMYAMVPSDGHWIKGRPDRSEGIIVLQNGSIWKVSPLDRIDMILWMALDDIALVEGRDASYPVLMINKSSKEQVNVKLLAK